jgi:hypothetical protein
MTRETYDKATVALDKTYKLQAIRDKIKRELPELEHDKQLKEWLSDDLFKLIESKIKASSDLFGSL